MKKFTDHVNENESLRTYKFTVNVVVEGSVEASSEGDAGYHVDNCMSDLENMIDSSSYLQHGSLKMQLPYDIQNIEAVVESVEIKTKPIIAKDSEEDVKQQVVDIFDLAEKKSTNMSIQEKALFFHMLASKFS